MSGLQSEEVYGALRKYVDDTLQGAGAVAGKPCQIQSITDNPDGKHTITFLWLDNSGVSHTSELIVRDGKDGADGTDGEDGADGVSPSVSVTTITGGHKVMVTDASGDHEFNVMDGEKGEQGEPGQDGAKGDKGDPGDDGADGEDGFSPIITVKTSTTDTYILHIVTADDEFDTPNLKGSGGGGTSDYEDLTNKPKIEGHTLESGNQTAASLGIASLDVTGALDTRVTALEENPVNPFQFDTMPEATDHPQEVIEYIGADTVNYKRGYFYRSTPVVVSGELTYVWQQQDTQPSNSNYEDMQNKPQINGVTLVGDKASSDLALQDEMQFATLPEASASLLGKIYQYTGANTASYKKGFFYQCVYDSENNVYVWQNTDVSDNAVLAGRVTTLETNQGDMSHLEVTGVVDLVSAINKVNARAGIERYAYVEPVLTIYYNDGSTFSISVGDILSETQIGELANVLDTTITDGQVLQYDAALQKYKPYAILTALQTCLQTAKDYTDQEISSAIVAGAYVCDEKPSYDAEHDTVIYKQSGVTKTTTQTDARFYYYSDGDPYCTSWIDDIEFTFSVADVDFEDYVNKNTDVVSTYTEDMLDKTKIPDVAALDALLAIVKTSLALKVNTSDIIDVLTSSDATKPLSAKQGKVLKDTVDTKQDIIQYATMPVADQPYLGKVAQYSGTTSGAYIKGQIYTCKYDNLNDVYYWDVVLMTADLGTLADGETKPVSGDEIYDALALKQNATMSAPVETETTVEGALGALSSNKQPKTLSTTIEGETTVEGCLTALSNKSVGVDGTTIVKDSTTGELSAVTATNNSVGVVKPDGTTITVDANGVISGANTLDFDTDDFDVVDDEVSLDASQKIKTFTQAGWNALSSAEKIALAGQNVIISDDEGTQTFEDIIPSDASASNKLATEGYVNSVCKNIQNIYDGGVYTTDTALITKIVEDVKALAETGKNVGGNISAVWTGKSFISGGYSLYGSSSGLVLLDFENATADGTHCQISINGSSTVVTWSTPAMVSTPQNGLITITSVLGNNANATTTYTNVGVGDLVNVVIDPGVLFIPSWWGTVSGLSSLGITNIQNIQGISGECRILARVCKTIEGSVYLDFLRDSGVATKNELKTTFALTWVDEHTCTFDLSMIPGSANGLCLISLVGGYNLESSTVCSIGYYNNEWRVDGLTTLVNSSNVGTVTASISGSTLTISNTGVNYAGRLSIKVGQLF